MACSLFIGSFIYDLRLWALGTIIKLSSPFTVLTSQVSSDHLEINQLRSTASPIFRSISSQIMRFQNQHRFGITLSCNRGFQAWDRCAIDQALFQIKKHKVLLSIFSHVMIRCKRPLLNVLASTNGF